MSSFDRLTELFMQFPGIGPRQAKRFVYFLLSRNGAFLAEFTRLLGELKNQSGVCRSCFRFFTFNGKRSDTCTLCADQNREDSELMVVAGNADLETVERAGVFRGRYFVLGGLVPILEKEPEKRVRLAELVRAIEVRGKRGLKEVILALPATPDGDHTTEYLSKELESVSKKNGLKLSTLGRGLSTGLELEYSDAETLKSALVGRK